MNRILIAVLSVLLLCGSLLAQSPQPPASDNTTQQQQIPASKPASSTPSAQGISPNQAPRLAPGSVIPVQLTKSVDAKKVKSGDEVMAKVTVDLKNNAGTVIVPKDTKVVGHVTEAQARSKEQKESEVAIAFDRVVPKNGKPMQMPMSIQAIIAPPNSNSTSASAAQPSNQATAGYPELGAASTTPGGRPGGMEGTTPIASVPQTTGSVPVEAPSGAQARQPITGNTKGVVGIANLTLSTAADTPQGSVVSSQKNNVKLDYGTYLLLRVDQ
ncbi:MAG: hypothetical protein WB566_10945 [Terriglobales bacterium]